jgi:hypothetical protein
MLALVEYTLPNSQYIPELLPVGFINAMCAVAVVTPELLKLTVTGVVKALPAPEAY